MELPDPLPEADPPELIEFSFGAQDDPVGADVPELSRWQLLGDHSLPDLKESTTSEPQSPTFAELATCSLAQLRERYELTGERFEDQEQLIERIRRDWKSAVAAEIERMEKADDIQNSLSETVVIGEQSYTIFGGTHCWGSGKEYHQIFESAIAEHQNILFEQGMARIFKYPRGAVPVADWAVGTNSEYFLIGLHAGLGFPLGVWEMLNPWQSRGDMKSLSCPIAIQNEVSGLPEQVAMELQHQEGVPLDFYQRRSAYQAAFMKYWCPGEDCAIHVGSLHATQIRYFLQSGIDNVGIEDLGRLHAQRAREKPNLYQLSYFGEWARAISVSMTGMILGMAPWGGAMYGVARLISRIMY